MFNNRLTDLSYILITQVSLSFDQTPWKEIELSLMLNIKVKMSIKHNTNF